MSTVKVDTIKPVTSGAALSLQGDSGGSAVDCLNIDSSGNIDFTGNIDAKIKLPSAGGIYESDGSTAILTESGAAVTLDNVTLGGSIALPTGTVFNMQSEYMPASVTAFTTTDSTGVSTGWGFTVTAASAAFIHLLITFPRLSSTTYGGDHVSSLMLMDHSSIPTEGTAIAGTDVAEALLDWYGPAVVAKGFPMTITYTYAPGGSDKNFYFGEKTLTSTTLTLYRTGAPPLEPHAIIWKEE